MPQIASGIVPDKVFLGTRLGAQNDGLIAIIRLTLQIYAIVFERKMTGFNSICARSSHLRASSSHPDDRRVSSRLEGDNTVLRSDSHGARRAIVVLQGLVLGNDQVVIPRLQHGSLVPHVRGNLFLIGCGQVQIDVLERLGGEGDLLATVDGLGVLVLVGLDHDAGDRSLTGHSDEVRLESAFGQSGTRIAISEGEGASHAREGNFILIAPSNIGESRRTDETFRGVDGHELDLLGLSLEFG